MKYYYRMRLDAIDFVHELFFSIVCWLDCRKNKALKRFQMYV